MNPEVFLSCAHDYFLKNPNVLATVVSEYLSTDVSHVSIEDAQEMLPSLLLGLYDFLSLTETIAKSIRDTLSSLAENEDYTALTIELLHIYTCGAIPVLFQFENAPKAFNRKMLIPLRLTLADFMYSALASLRSSLNYPVYIESEENAFVSPMEYNIEDEKTFLASDYAAYAIYDLVYPKVTYGYDEAWVFHVSLSSIRILNPDLAKKQIHLLDGAGYGIFEENKDNVLALIKNPLARNLENIRIKDMLGVEFSDIRLNDLKESLTNDFYMTQYRYEANPEV